jgi:eukaryotic-like serine/threonine-protein kinase
MRVDRPGPPDFCVRQSVPWRSGIRLCLQIVLIASCSWSAPQSIAGAGTERPTIASPLTYQDTILLTDVDNRTGDATFDDSLQQALRIELGQSPFINLVSDRRLKNALLATRHSSDVRITEDIGKQLCVLTDSKGVLSTWVSVADAGYTLGMRAIECGSDHTFAELHAASPRREGVLKNLSQLTAGIRLKLGEPADSVRDFNVPVEVITASLEALQNYGKGSRVRGEKGDVPSLAFLKRAVELDADFPLANAELAAIYGNLRQPSLALEYATKAYQSRDRVTAREKLRISAAYYFATGELEKEIETYEVWEKTYPRDPLAHNNLGNEYAATGQFDKALAEYERAVQLAPSVASYANVMGIQLSLNQTAEAQATFQQAFAQQMDGRYVRQTMYLVAFVKRDFEEMKQQIAWAAGKQGDEDALLSLQSDTDAYFGRLASARNLTQKAVSSALQADATETAALWRVNAALREAEVGNDAAAQFGTAAALALSSGRDVKVIAALTLARAAKNSRAIALLAQLKKEYPYDAMMRVYWFPTIKAAIALNEGKYAEAIANLESTKPYELGEARTFVNYLYPAYVRGEAYLRTHNPEAAIGEFQKLINYPGVVLNFVTGALVPVQLGRAYAMAGQMDQAKKAYEDFFANWRDADTETPIMRQARSEYSKLREHA